MSMEVVCVFFVYMHSTILLPEHPLVALHVSVFLYSSMIFANEITKQSHQVSFHFSKLNHKQRNRQAAHLFLQTRIWVGFLARGLVCKRCWIRLAVNRILNFGFRVELMFKTFGRLNVKQGH